MDKLKTGLFAALFMCISVFSQAQQVEIGVLLGGSNYLGDVSNESFVMKESHFAGGLYGRFNFNPKWAIKGYFGFGQLSGDDKNFADVKRDYTLDKVPLKDFEFNKARNLNFYTDVYEFTAQLEYNLLPNELTNYQYRPFVPYVFIGLGVFNFNPKSTFLGKEVELQPLATEGQGSTSYNNMSKYPLTAIAIPVGIGFRQKIGDDFFVGIEGGLRFTNTNYLDDVGGKYGSGSVILGATGRTGLFMADRSWELNPAADPNTATPLAEAFVFHEGDKRSDRQFSKNDMYFMAGLTLTYTLRFRGQGCPTF